MDEFARCSVCARTPIVGETVSLFRTGRRERPVCDLCIAKPRAQALGDPVGRVRVRSAAGAANVHRIFPEPVLAPGRAEPARPGEAVA
jgi:hypothetical protein